MLYLAPFSQFTFCVDDFLFHNCYMSFPGGSDGKASTYNEGDPGSIPRLGRSSGKENSNPLQYSCLENPMDREVLVGYNQWGCEESDTTKRLHFLPF